MKSQLQAKQNWESPIPISHMPVPSFLTQTPLGTPYNDSVSLKNPSHTKASKTENVNTYLKKAVTSPQNTGENRVVHRWIGEEVRLSMSKTSIMSLVLGLLFLGTLFFIIGFLAAVATLKTEDGAHRPQSAWQASNTSSHTNSNSNQGAQSQLGRLTSNLIRTELAPVRRAVNSATSAIVPRPLQPFARYGIGNAQTRIQNTGQQLNPFAQRRRPLQQPPLQQPYGRDQQTPGTYPQYATQPQASVFGNIAPSSGLYQQPFPQGGQGYGFPQPQQIPTQQMLPQQPYYLQQPMQQQAPQPMAPQQQMVPSQPQYPQQYAPQMRYTR